MTTITHPRMATRLLEKLAYIFLVTFLYISPYLTDTSR